MVEGGLVSDVLVLDAAPEIVVCHSDFLSTCGQLVEHGFRFALQIRDKVTEANEAVLEIRRVKGEVDDRQERTDNAEIETVGRRGGDRVSVTARGVRIEERPTAEGG